MEMTLNKQKSVLDTMKEDSMKQTFVFYMIFDDLWDMKVSWETRDLHEQYLLSYF